MEESSNFDSFIESDLQLLRIWFFNGSLGKGMYMLEIYSTLPCMCSEEEQDFTEFMFWSKLLIVQSYGDALDASLMLLLVEQLKGLAEIILIIFGV